jgi:ribonuclease III
VRRRSTKRARDDKGQAPAEPAGPADLAGIEKRLAYTFRDRKHLVRALTHSSHAHEEGGGPDNEALEFLGDATLGYIVSHALLERFPALDEGGLSKFKAFLVSRGNLATTARGLDLGLFLRLGKTAEKGQGRTKESLLADALEAIIAAVLLDGGDAAARGLVARLFDAQIDGLNREDVEKKDFKTALQEWMQARGRQTPQYRVVSTEGPPHNPTFHISLLSEEKEVARGRGRTKKQAEQRAARMALRLLQRKGGTD